MLQNAPRDVSGEAPTKDELIALTSDVVAAYVGNNAIATSDLPELIGAVYTKLSALSSPPAEAAADQKPAVPVKRSIKNDAIICLECGKGQKMLKRHLAAAHGLTPEEYKAKWGLGHDYPIVAPDYAEKRRKLAKQIGLGRTPAKASPKRKTNNKKAG